MTYCSRWAELLEATFANVTSFSQYARRSRRCFDTWSESSPCLERELMALTAPPEELGEDDLSEVSVKCQKRIQFATWTHGFHVQDFLRD